eukprot:PhF_6_TR16959/c0_g1_i1/m.25587/K14799/TSR1; pre-rRNA-processing protein TSR1
MGHQKNKAHKKKFSSKGEVKRKTSGKPASKHNVSMPRTTIKGCKGGALQHDKERRQQITENRRLQTRQIVLNARRLGRGHGTRIITFLPMSGVSDAHQVRNDVERIMGADGPSERGAPPRRLVRDGLTVTLVTPGDGELLEMIDSMMVADIAVLVVRVGEGAVAEDAEPDLPMDADRMTTSTWFSDVGLGIDDDGRRFVSCINAQGVPTVVVVLQGLRSIASAKKRHQLAKVHLRYFRSVLPPSHIVLHSTDTQEDSEKLWRSLKEITLHPLHWREARPYFLTEDLSYDPSTGNLLLTGALRGKRLNANQLVHVTNFGTYQLDAILNAENGEVIDKPDDAQESLETCKPLDPLAGEQTWPTADDFRTSTRAVKVPEGFSEYQAAWVDFQDNVIPYDEPDYAKEPPLLDDDCVDPGMEDDDNSQLDEIEDGNDEDPSQKKDIENDDDVIDLEPSETARERLGKYRGLPSFRAAWDLMENLPPSYSRIFMLSNYKRIVKETQKEGLSLTGRGANIGTFVTLVLRNVSPAVNEQIQNNPSMPIIVSGLLPEEQKWSVLHTAIHKDPEYEEPIKSKQRALYQLGFRRLLCCPLYSDLGKGDRTKFARYYDPGDKVRGASFFGPITHTPAPVMVYLRGGGQWNYVAHGSVAPPDPNYMILKRAVLTGTPAKVHKRQAVIKFMFYNNEDVDWFKPVELRTRFGHRGRILKAIGSHGSFKAGFKDIVQQHDTVYLELWKRVFPKWNTRPYDLSVVKFQAASEAGDREVQDE